jgi:hypothetical protein
LKPIARALVLAALPIVLSVSLYAGGFIIALLIGMALTLLGVPGYYMV